MADISIPEPRVARVREAAQRAFAAADEAVHGGLASSVGVAAVAAALTITHVELQYVAGAFLIVFAKRLASKKLSRDVLLPEEQPKRKHADVFPTPPAPLGRDLSQLADD